ncbi:hypothetical protein CW663_11530 [Macrococcoides caseolyticum]|nr:hypothetical protein CW663_11530 [Macrococcus caseolyticus]
MALVVVPVLGLDSIGLATRLHRQPAERTFLQAQADDLFGTQAPQSCANGSVDERVKCSRDAAAKLSGLRVSAYQIPKEERGPAYLLLLGFAVTFAAVTAGAPFWFGILQRLTGTKTSYKK